ncbi:MAG: protein kinase [Deltaproteobacteria bacterium]|nr:protein kinase [Deltaproteobacteria bacterium]MBN2673098.1 protein kinase [Deltaproteobacteria bacterium]
MKPSKLSATSFTFSDKDLPVRMGKYHLLSRFSRDPISEQFLSAWGVEQGIDQLRVIRCIYPRVAQEAEFIGLFQEEARALSRLSSDNIARIMEVSVQGDIPFVAREYVEGLTLDRMVELASQQKEAWPWELAAHVITEMLRGLDYIHRREDIHGNPMGMRHGDVRLNNVIVSFSGEVKLLNFGSMLRFIVDEATHAQLIRLRSPYLPPHVEDDAEPSVAADLWAVAMIFVALLGGQLPSESTSEWSPPTVSELAVGVPDALNAFIFRALHADQSERYSTAASMRSVLVEIMGEYAEGHPPDGLAELTTRLGKDDSTKIKELIRFMLSRTAELALETTTQSATTLGPGYVLDGRYHLLRELGEGGMGTVFEAEHKGLNKRCAVKVLHERVMSDSNTVERFKREARIIGNIGHPNIVGAQDFGVSEKGYYYLAMDLLDGKPLSHRIWEANFSYGEIATVMAEVCDGLQAAHEAGVIHRDLKPDNVHLTSSGARILDFGIAKSVGLDSENEALTRTGHICGTVDYIAPEQIRGGTDDARSDLYAVGVMIYECLTGETPFHGRTVGEALHKAINDKLVSPSKRTGKKDIPTQLEAICVKALHKNADKRYSSAVEMAKALREVAAKLGEREKTRAPDESSVKLPASGSGQKSRAILVPVIVGVGLLAFIGGAVALFGDTKAQKDTDENVPKLVDDEESSLNTIKAAADSPEGYTAGMDGDHRMGVSDSPSIVMKPASLAVDTEVAVNDTEDSDVAAMMSELREREETKEESLELAVEFTESGNAHLRARRFDAATKDFKQAIHHDHRSSDAWFGLGKTAYATGDYQTAIKKVEQSLIYSPASKKAKRRNFLGVLYKASGNMNKATEQWQKVLALYPNDVEAKRHLGLE